MIDDKKSLYEYLDADRIALGIKKKRPNFFGDEVWKFQIALRYIEYYINTGKRDIKYLWWKWKFHNLGIKLGFHIPPNVCGKGLKIVHSGCVIINNNAKLGENVVLQQCINIGRNHEVDDVPIIGNGVYIGPGAKLFGKIYIADNCAIGAGAVVTKSFERPGMNIVGNPAHEQGERRAGL